jgi:hypothetical protein
VSHAVGIRLNRWRVNWLGEFADARRETASPFGVVGIIVV